MKKFFWSHFVPVMIVGLLAGLATMTWIRGVPCPLMSPFGEFKHSALTVVPIGALELFLIVRLWRKMGRMKVVGD